MSYHRNWLHVNFSTKDRARLIKTEHESKIYEFMKEQLRKCGCIPVIINGTHDHVHLLFLMTGKMSLDEVMQRVKGGSSFFINKNQLCDYKFQWQDGYATFSVSDSGADAVQCYIANQKRHHKVKGYEEEL